MCFEIHRNTHIHTRKVSVCVCWLLIQWLDWTSLICYRLSVCITIASIDTFGHLFPPLSLSQSTPLPLSTLYLSCQRIDRRHLPLFDSFISYTSRRVRAQKKKRREVINLFNASLIELTLAGSSEQRFQSNHQRFLYTPFSIPSIPMRRCRQIAFLSLSLCLEFPSPLPLLHPWYWPLGLFGHWPYSRRLKSVCIAYQKVDDTSRWNHRQATVERVVYADHSGGRRCLSSSHLIISSHLMISIFWPKLLQRLSPEVAVIGQRGLAMPYVALDRDLQNRIGNRNESGPHVVVVQATKVTRVKTKRKI